jgi:hypothetical protein
MAAPKISEACTEISDHMARISTTSRLQSNSGHTRTIIDSSLSLPITDISSQVKLVE